MSVAEANELSDVLDRVRTWPPALRITLARRILETMELSPNVEEPPQRIPLDQIFGLLKTDAPPPTDEECARIIEEERMRKYG
jgi:hypothetical protein